MFEKERAGWPDERIDYRNVNPTNAFPMALRAMRDWDFMRSHRFRNLDFRANKKGADPKIIEFTEKFLRRLRLLGLPFYAHTMVRTYDDQMSAYVRGVTKDSPADGKWPHRFAAVDIVHGKHGWMDDPVIPDGWDLVGHLGKEVAQSMNLKVIWGGDWKFYDPAHWELFEWQHMVPPDERVNS